MGHGYSLTTATITRMFHSQDIFIMGEFLVIETRCGFDCTY